MMTNSLRTNSPSRTPVGSTRQTLETRRLHARSRPPRVGEGLQQSRYARPLALRGRAIDGVHPQRAPHRSILCIDDDQETARLLAEALAELGYAVELAPDGELGLVKILTNRPNLVLCSL